MKNNKGFTIVELVIVIAVIAILAAVLIPTFSGVIQKANDSAALQTARSTLTNSLNMSSTAQLSGKTAAGDYTTMIVVDGHAYGYTGNELEAIDYPNADNKVFKTTAENGVNSYNSILIAAENLVVKSGSTAETDGAEYEIKNVLSIISAFSSDNKLGCTNLTVTTVYYCGGHYYLNGTFTAASGDAAAKVEDYDAELFLNSDFSNKVVVFTTFAN